MGEAVVLAQSHGGSDGGELASAAALEKRARGKADNQARIARV